MAAVHLMLADKDRGYLVPLVRKFIDGIGINADIEAATDQAYLESFFETPKSLDILVIQEEMYRDEFSRHNIGDIFLLTENEDDAPPAAAHRIYKYTDADTVYKQVVNNLSGTTSASIRRQGETRIIYVYSPSGGSGKTTVAAGICRVLSECRQRTLFVGMDALQSFGWIMDEEETLPGGVERQLISNSGFVYNMVKPYLKEQGFFVLPPFSRILSSLNIREESYVQLLETTVVSRDFDYIVVDGTSGFSLTTSKLMGMSQYVLILATQDGVSGYKTERLLENLDLSDRRRFVFACNKYEKDKPDMFGRLAGEKGITLSGHIPKVDVGGFLKPGQAAAVPELQKVAYMFM